MSEEFNAETQRHGGRREGEGRHENEISGEIIGAAIDVHREIGPGLIESVYEEALCHELNLRGLSLARQRSVALHYKGVKLANDLRLDLFVEGKVIVELKAKEQLSAVDKPILLTYLRLLNVRLGLLINFQTAVLKDGVFRVVNNLAEPPIPNDSEPPDLRA